MSRYVAIDLGALPPPDVVQTLDYESILAALRDDFARRYPEHSALLESDPVIKLLESWAYREVLLRQRVNDAARSVLLATATGTNLDHLGALYGVTRLLLDPGDPVASPPVPPTYERDADFRARIQLAPEGLSVAGPAGAYRYHALAAHADVADVAVSSPAPGDVVVSILARSGDGTPGDGVLAAVTAALNDEDVRPLTDRVTVQAGTVLPYALHAVLRLYDGPDAGVVRAAALAGARRYTTAHHRLGDPVTVSGLLAALHVEGVQRVDLISPAAGVEPQAHEAPFCTGITITTEAA